MNLTAAGPPLPPDKFQQEGEATSKTVRLSWLPNYPGGNFKQRFVLEYKLQSDSEWKAEWKSNWFEGLSQSGKMFHNITNLKAEQVYDFRLTAENYRPKYNLSKPVTLTVMTTKGRNMFLRLLSLPPDSKFLKLNHSKIVTIIHWQNTLIWIKYVGFCLPILLLTPSPCF